MVAVTIINVYFNDNTDTCIPGKFPHDNEFPEVPSDCNFLKSEMWT